MCLCASYYVHVRYMHLCLVPCVLCIYVFYAMHVCICLCVFVCMLVIFVCMSGYCVCDVDAYIHACRMLIIDFAHHEANIGCHKTVSKATAKQVSIILIQIMKRAICRNHHAPT